MTAQRCPRRPGEGGQLHRQGVEADPEVLDPRLEVGEQHERIRHRPRRARERTIWPSQRAQTNGQQPVLCRAPRGTHAGAVGHDKRYCAGSDVLAHVVAEGGIAALEQVRVHGDHRASRRSLPSANGVGCRSRARRASPATGLRGADARGRLALALGVPLRRRDQPTRARWRCRWVARCRARSRRSVSQRNSLSESRLSVMTCRAVGRIARRRRLRCRRDERYRPSAKLPCISSSRTAPSWPRPDGGVVEHARWNERASRDLDARVLVLRVARDVGVALDEGAEQLVRVRARRGLPSRIPRGVAAARGREEQREDEQHAASELGDAGDGMSGAACAPARGAEGVEGASYHGYFNEGSAECSLDSADLLPLGVTGNTPDSGSGESWFDPRRGN